MLQYFTYRLVAVNAVIYTEAKALFESSSSVIIKQNETICEVHVKAIRMYFEKKIKNVLIMELCFPGSQLALTTNAEMNNV